MGQWKRGEIAMASNSNSNQEFARDREPCVHVTCEDPYDAE
jgi:hypothetical protein